jgi:hypothetical protein
MQTLVQIVATYHWSPEKIYANKGVLSLHHLYVLWRIGYEKPLSYTKMRLKCRYISVSHLHPYKKQDTNAIVSDFTPASKEEGSKSRYF